jgi:hypothetical protein
VYWDTGNSWCAIMQVVPRPGEEAWAQRLTAELHEREDEEAGLDSVPCSDCDTPVEPGDPFYATPCGTYCEECMCRHMSECEICRHEFLC